MFLTEEDERKSKERDRLMWVYLALRDRVDQKTAVVMGNTVLGQGEERLFEIYDEYVKSK